MSAVDMMMKQAIPLVFKHLGLNGDDVMKQVESIKTTVGNVGTTVATILSLLLMINRRLHRLETAAGLSDIEPVPTQIMVIENEKASSDVAGAPGAVVALPVAGA